MRRRLLALSLILALSPAATAAPTERRVDLSSFSRLRVEGPFLVTLTTGPSPRGTLSGDAEALRGVETRLSEGTLIVRQLSVGEGSPRGRGPVSLTLAAPPLSAITVVGGGQVVAQAMRGATMALAISGAGDIRIDTLNGEQLTATLLGPAKLTIGGGRVGKARLLTNGPAALYAEGLDAGELVATLEGPGEVRARARYTAMIANAGLGRVTVEGTPKCRVTGGGPVRCGTK